MKVKAKVLKGFHQFEEGKTYSFQEKTFKALEKKGYVEKEKATRKKAAPKKEDK